MNIKLSFKFLFLFILLLVSNISRGQGYDRLEKSCEEFAKFQIEITLPENSYKSIRNSTGNKLRFSNVQLHCNGEKIAVKSMNLRGKTSLYFPKKSFTLKLKDHLEIQEENDTISFKDCYLLSLSMDQNYTVNHTAYLLLKYLDIFNLTFHYCEVLINNNTQGIYLVMERPKDYAFQTLNSPVLIRRGFNSEIDEIELNDKVYREKPKYFRNKFNHMYSLCRKYSGVELFDSLNTYIDLNQYMRWIGFNYLVKNGDYTDELHLYYDTAKNLFRIIPWDYDDLFVLNPHEGSDIRRSVHGGQFIFSSEDRLDQTIIRDKYLYQRYLEQLANIITQLNDAVLLDIFQKTYCSVYPYYLDNEIIKITQFDKYGLTDKEDLYVNMQKKLNALHGMRDLVGNELKPDNDSRINK